MKLIAEFLGTMLLVIAGCGSMVIDELYGISPVVISLSFGGIVALVIIAIGKLSGAHINPAVTWGFRMAGEIDTRTALYYTIAQVSGGILGALILRFIFPRSVELGITLAEKGLYAAMASEFLLTFGLMLSILIAVQVFKHNVVLVAIAVGLYVGLACYFLGPVSRAGMNPARTIGPSIVSGIYSYPWVYLLLTTAGAMLAGKIFHTQSIKQRRTSYDKS